MRGAFILFEGIDRCGKSTQAQNLVKYLNSNGHPTELLRFPGNCLYYAHRTTTTGVLLDAYLRKAKELDDHALHLLFSANRWEQRDVILRHLQGGTTIVVDRYAYSGVAFSAAKGLALEWCKAPDRGLPAPDVVVYLKLTIEEAAARGGYGEERYEKLEFQQKVKTLYEGPLADNLWTSIDATQSMEDIHKQLCSLATTTIQAVKEKPVLPLWS